MWLRLPEGKPVKTPYPSMPFIDYIYNNMPPGRLSWLHGKSAPWHD